MQVQLEKFRGRKFQLSEVAQVARIPLDKKSLDNLQDDLRVLIALGIVKLELVNGVVHYSLTQTIGETK